jgi:CDGSH iron-sulfur domain-containing protein 3
MSESLPIVAQKGSYKIEVEAGKAYFWCSCGQSSKQPFCDGSHKGSAFTPQEFTSPSDRTLYFCACKNSKHAPLCDGTHKSL